MIKPFIITMSLGIQVLCPVPEVRNKTKVWNNFDRQVFKQAQKRCGELFSESPCLKIFLKSEEMVYSVMCSKPEENKSASE